MAKTGEKIIYLTPVDGDDWDASPASVTNINPVILQ
jgi:hypothetical protein